MSGAVIGTGGGVIAYVAPAGVPFIAAAAEKLSVTGPSAGLTLMPQRRIRSSEASLMLCIGLQQESRPEARRTPSVRYERLERCYPVLVTVLRGVSRYELWKV